MKVNYIIDHIPKDTPNNRRPGLSLVPEHITIHSTGNPGSTARNERAWLTNPVNKRTASWHICVDEREAVEAIPPGEVAWHAGDGGSGPGNRKSIAIEICESGNREKTLANAAKLTAKLLQGKGWGIDRLRRHFYWSGKACPRILMADNWAGWENFEREVQKHLDTLKSILDQINPVIPSKPVGPAELADLVNPAGSLIAADQSPAADPANTTKPIDAADPASPTVPANPVNTAIPAKPVNPATPEEPKLPDNPTKPTAIPANKTLPQIQRSVEAP